MEEDMMEKIKLLEAKVLKVVETLKQEREENRALHAKITAIDDEIRAKDEEIMALRSERENAGRAKQDLAHMNEERSIIRSQVETLLQELESIELN